MLAYNHEFGLCLLSYVSRSIGRKLAGLLKNNHLKVDGMEAPWLMHIQIPAERPGDGPVLPNTHGGKKSLTAELILAKSYILGVC